MSFTGEPLTTQEKINSLVEYGMCATKDEAVFILLDMGEISEMDENPDVQDCLERRDGGER